jgi:Flp pilus assembly protein TadD
MRMHGAKSLDYYGPMTPIPRRYRLAAAVSLVLLSLTAMAQTDPAAPDSPAPIVDPAVPPVKSPPAAVPTPAASDVSPEAVPAQPSAMTAELFYEVLLGELTTRGGDAGDGYALMLDSARKSNDPVLFQRTVEIALQARSGESALRAVRAWKEALPQSKEASRFELQILIALNRIGETVEPLRVAIAATPQVERPLLFAVIARNYSRATDKKLAAAVVEQALSDELRNPASAALAWTTIGRLRLNAGDTSGALAAALKGEEADAASEGPAVLALDLIDPNQPLAEPLVRRYLQQPTALPELRMAYTRLLLEQRRYPEAKIELSTLTTVQPAVPEAWLLLGTLQGFERQDAASETSLKRYIDLAAVQQSDGDDRKRGLAQAYILLSQLAERRKDFAGAERWLAKMDDGDDLVASQSRRAALLARQGKVQQAMTLLRELPETKPEDAKLKFAAQVQLLRDVKQYETAYDMLAKATTASPNDSDLIYDQAMVAEKLLRFDEMERLLRRLMVLKPDNQNAYNALGYSLADRKVKLDEARTLIQKALTLAPGDPFITDSLGWVEFRLGNTTEATRILEGAYKNRPDPEIGAHLGEVLWSAGDRERAMIVLKESSIADADNETLQDTLKRLRVKF